MTKKCKKKKTRNANDKKINKEKKTTKNWKNLSFKSLSHGLVYHLQAERDANSWHS